MSTSPPNTTVKHVIGMLVTDVAFRDAFSKDPQAALAAKNLILSAADLKMLLGGEMGKSRGPQSEVLDDRIKRRSDDLI